jgi:hypothetical protein
METRGIVLEAIKQQQARGIVMSKVVEGCRRMTGFVITGSSAMIKNYSGFQNSQVAKMAGGVPLPERLR